MQKAGDAECRRRVMQKAGCRRRVMQKAGDAEGG